MLRLTTLAAVVLALGACVDSPTQPDQHRAPDLAAQDVRAQGCVSDGGVCLLPPQSGGGGDTCDPYQELDNSCDDDTCMTSAPEHGRPTEPGRSGGATTQGCPGDGSGGDGGGGGSGGGGGGGGETGTEPSPETEDLDDYISPQDSIPNCTVTQTVDWAKAYCRANAPTGARLDSINAALNRIEQRGTECASIAAEGRRLLGLGRLQVFAAVSGDAGGWGAPTIGVLIADYWVDDYSSAVSTDNRNLEHTLSHEIDHALRRQHTDAAGYETPNSRACSGLSGTSP